jgi:4-amino-4-deoxy-L-arabinose transferase-like glycosyltransferase
LKPFLVTALQAARMPRWLLMLVGLLYVVPGLVGRDPWRIEDAEGFGIAYTMALGDRSDWLLPNVFGQAVTAEGPLPFWLGALAMGALPWLEADAAFQFLAMAWIALLLGGVWYATFLLARRPEVQPADLFGASASRRDFARAVADCALLLTVATFGLLARVHETTAEAAQVAWIGLFLVGCALALERPRWGGVVVGLAIGFTTLSRGIAPAAALALTTALLSALSGPFRLVAMPFAARWVTVAVVVSLSWPLLLVASGLDAGGHLDRWLQWNLAQVAGPSQASVGYAARTLPWFLWPAWPLAVWAVWRWHGRGLEPALALPGITFLMLLAVALLSPQGGESVLLPLAPPLALVAALALPTVRRGVTSLIDWFAVMTFTLIGFVLWAYWIAFQTGWPPRMARVVNRAVGGFEPTLDILGIVLAVAASIAWIVLVRWRVSGQPRAMWRSVLLSSGGMVLTWFLLMTLWLPAGNHRKTYRDPAQQAGAVVATAPGCVLAVGLDGAQRASFAYFGGLRFEDLKTGAGAGMEFAGCSWALVANDTRTPVDARFAGSDWTFVWRGQRPADRRDQFLLFRR